MKKKYIGKVLKDSQGIYLKCFDRNQDMDYIFKEFLDRNVVLTISDFEENHVAERELCFAA